MAEITSVTSEALQATVRRLLPSQQGFGEDLQASNVITPIIDLTATAEGSSVPQMLQTALASGSNTAFEAVNTVVNTITTPGFYRFIGTSNIFTTSSLVRETELRINDGTTLFTLFKHKLDAATAAYPGSILFDLVIFAKASEDIQAVSNATDTVITGSFRQIADVNGNLVNPSGFTPS